MSKNKETVKSEFYCTECGNKGIPIARRIGQQRKSGHLKKIFCLHCQKETNHVEIRPYGGYRYEDFLEEFELGRFVNGEKTPINELLYCSKETCYYNRDMKCWNSKGDYICKHRRLKENK